MIKLTVIEQTLHDEAVEICTRRSRDEVSLIRNLQKNGEFKLYKKFERSSLFQYAINELKLPDSVALMFINVARKASEFPCLNEAIKNSRISVTKASRIVSALKKGNAKELVEFAIKNSQSKVDREVARLNPKARCQDKVKWLSEDAVQLTATHSKAGFENLSRAEALAAQKGFKFSSRGDVMDLALAEYVERHDPLKKAKRAIERKAKADRVQAHTNASVDRGAALASTDFELQVQAESNLPAAVSVEKNSKNSSELCANRVFKGARVEPSAEQKHAVNIRDQGRCTHIDRHGERCTNDRYLHIHHVIPVSQGGSNDPSNLFTLCSVHHDLIHQLSFPIDQITWLHSPHGSKPSGICT